MSTIFKRLIALFLCLVMITGILPAHVFAQESDSGQGSFSGTFVNPRYAHIISEEALSFTKERPMLADSTEDPVYLASPAEAGAVLRKAMKARENSCTVYYMTSAYEDSQPVQIIETAMAHTGIPTEGDYLQWQYSGLWYGGEYYYFDGNCYVSLTYEVDYFTTAAQEAQMDTAVTALLNNLALNNDTDYNKICGIYDYICDNITYDYANLEDETYLLKHSAYAALIHKTAVCQGYAVLFYRLALELGVDSRVVTGTGAGGPHAWNIVKLDNAYYLLDSTWDAGAYSYGYYLRGSNYFPDHYAGDDWGAMGYNISTTNYVPKAEPTHTASDPVLENEVAATCDTAGSYDVVVYCSECGAEMSRETNSVSSLGHDMSDWQTEKEAGCTEAGSKTRTCKREGCTHKETEPIEASGHSYKSVVIAPTCTEGGYTTHTCTCGDSYVDSEKEALGHEMSEWNVTKDPTCTEDGSQERSCQREGCEHEETDVIEAKGHDWDDGIVTKKPTTEETGIRVYTCGTCGETKDEVIPVLEIVVPAKPYKIVNTMTGPHVYWNAVDGVQKYGVFRSETGKNGTYKWIGNLTTTHYLDTKVESGKTYFYKVASIAEGKQSELSEATGIIFVSTPDITTRMNLAEGIKLGWPKIPGATGYAIYRKSYAGSDAWVRVATITGGDTLTWTDTDVKAKNGEVYKYTIRALAGSNMKTLSGNFSGRTMTRLTSMTLNSATKTSATSVKCYWTTSSRVTGYEMRFMVGDEVYKTFTVGNYKTGAKTFTGLKAGQEYTVQVRTYKKVDGVGSFYSDWSAAKTVKI